MKTILLKNSHTFRLGLADPTPIAEADFEKVAIETLRDLYPECHVFSFKPTIQYNGVGWRPDLAVVDKSFAYWFVVEVEIAAHSLEKHVLPQVRAFRFGDYGDQVSTILSRDLKISRDIADTLVRFMPRYIAVVTNHEDSEWSLKLSAENTQLITIASYSADGADRHALFIGGSLIVAQKSIGFGQVHATLQSIILPLSNFWEEKTYRISDASGYANWSCKIDGERVWLSKNQGLIQLPDKCWVQFIQQNNLVEIRPIINC